MSKIILPIAELKPALAGLGKIISKRCTLPVLGMVRIDRTKDGWVTLTGTDLDAFVTVRLEEPVAGEPASVLVPYEDLAKTGKGCSTGEAITIEQSANDAAILHYPVGQQMAEVKVHSLAAEEFPPVPKIKGDPVSLPEALRIALQEAFDCASTDETRYVLNGAYIDVTEKNCHQVVATDGSHLYSSNSFVLPLTKSVVIPTHKFLGWKEFNADGEWQFRVEPGRNKESGFFQISTRRWRFIHRQIDGNYPNWRQVMPKNDEFKTTVDFEPAAVKDLIRVIDRMPDEDKVYHRIGIRISGRKVSFTSTADSKQLEVPVPESTAKGKDVVFSLNRNYLIRALAFKLCHLQVVDEITAVRFSDQAGRQMIVMPVRPADAPSPVTPAAPTPPDSSGNGAPETVESENSTERSTIMPKPSTNGHANGNGPNGHQTEQPQPVTIDTALEHIETVKGSYREAIRGLNTLTDTLKQVQKGQKTTEKEAQSVRSTLEKLQSVRI